MKLCFNCFALEQEGTVAGGIGVYVAPGRSNVTIEDGTIKRFTKWGIALQSGTECIKVDAMKVLECGSLTETVSAGLTSLRTREFIITRSQFLKNFRFGIFADNVKDFTMRNSDCNQTQGAGTSPSTDADGLCISSSSMLNSENIRIENCSFNCAKATIVRGIIMDDAQLSG